MNHTPLSDLRDDHAEQYRRWRERNIEQAREREDDRNRRYQEATKPYAVRDGKPWTEEDFIILMQDRPLIDTALELQRTYRACLMARRRRKKMLGIDTSSHKTEDDPYNG